MVLADAYMIDVKVFLLAEVKMLHPCCYFIIFVLLCSYVFALGRK